MPEIVGPWGPSVVADCSALVLGLKLAKLLRFDNPLKDERYVVLAHISLLRVGSFSLPCAFRGRCQRSHY